MTQAARGAASEGGAVLVSGLLACLVHGDRLCVLIGHAFIVPS